MAELTVGLAQYFAFYDDERPYQAPGYARLDHVYRGSIEGSAIKVRRRGPGAGENWK